MKRLKCILNNSYLLLTLVMVIMAFMDANRMILLYVSAVITLVNACTLIYLCRTLTSILYAVLMCGSIILAIVTVLNKHASTEQQLVVMFLLLVNMGVMIFTPLKANKATKRTHERGAECSPKVTGKLNKNKKK